MGAEDRALARGGSTARGATTGCDGCELDCTISMRGAVAGVDSAAVAALVDAGSVAGSACVAARGGSPGPSPWYEDIDHSGGSSAAHAGCE
jgi:hypothetical protein